MPGLSPKSTHIESFYCFIDTLQIKSKSSNRHIKNILVLTSGKRIGHIRVSSIDQNIDRQFENIQLDKIYTDRYSGKNTDRPALQELLNYVRDGDHVFV